MTSSSGFLASVHGLFNNESLRRFLTKARVPFGILAGALTLPLVRPEWFVGGFCVSLVGALLQSWCFACLHKKKVLAARGPYALVRNPMYLARFFVFFGMLILIGNPWVLAVFTILYAFYMVNRVRREEAVLAPIFGAEYVQYCAEVRRFVPSLRPYRNGRVAVFDRDLFRLNNGFRNLLVVLVFYAAALLYVLLVR